MNTCAENKIIANQVWDFISFVDDVNEESITDYLVWQWRKLNRRFNYISVQKHTKRKENTISGADFELELWILTDGKALPIVFQAKKLLKDYNSYTAKLAYKAAQNILQVDKLISYSQSVKKYPFYIFYAQTNNETKTRCKMSEPLDNIALFITDAMSVKTIISNHKSMRLSKNGILKETTPFHCLFCCPYALKDISKYFSEYFPNIIAIENPIEPIPRYVYEIASGSSENIDRFVEEYELQRFRNIGVIDLRSNKEDENGR